MEVWSASGGGESPVSEQAAIQRAILPIPDQPYVGLVTYDAKDQDTTFPPIRNLHPPEGAPNVLVVLIDDAGFGSSSAFGGPCETPNFERLANNGLRYNRFTPRRCGVSRSSSGCRTTSRSGAVPWQAAPPTPAGPGHSDHAVAAHLRAPD
jgi:hypothetical protein